MATSRDDPLNRFAQNVIKNNHRDLQAQLPLFSQSVEKAVYSQVDLSSQSTLISIPKNVPKVGIIGGGIGGLYAAKLLQKLGIPYEILEASSRLGGRLYTKRMGDRPNDYYDVGAMRFPKTPIMDPLFELFDELSLKLGDYYFKDKNANSTLLYNDVNKKRFDGPVKPNDFDITGILAEPWGNIGWQRNVSNVVDPFANALIQDFKENQQEGWELMMKYDQYSMRAYMAGNRSDTARFLDKEGLMPYPINVVNWCETFDKSSGWYDRGLTETVLEALAFQYDGSQINWKYIVGGSSELAKTLDQYMAKKPGYTRPFFNSRVTGIACVSVTDIPTTASPVADAPLQTIPTPYVDLQAGCPNIPKDGCVAVQLSNGRTRLYSHVITTTTLPCLRTMDLRYAKLDWQQKEALRMLQYGPSTKIGVRFRRRWWEDEAWMKKSGAYGAILGGQSYTDNMSRTVVYPSYGIGDDLSGATIIVSYAWTNDALALSSLMGSDSQATLKQRVLQDLVEIHKFNIWAARELEEEWEAVHAFSWSNNPMTMGAFAFFGPGDFKKLYPALTRPASGGRLHFAGEVISVRHAWVIGAIEASTRAVHEILCESYPDKVKDFEQECGFAEGWTREMLMKQVAVTLEDVIGEFPPGLEQKTS